MKKHLYAEFIGTYFLVFAAAGAVIVNQLTNSLTHLGVALTSGLMVTALIYAFGHISGAHFNPAVTLGFWVNGQIGPRRAVLYIGTQLLGALAASESLRLLFGGVVRFGITAPRFSWHQSFCLEFIFTFWLVMVTLGTATHGRAVKSFAGLAVGATVALAALIGGPISGASMNPARSIGPALISGVWHGLWIYVAATVLGAIAAAFAYRFLHE